MLDSDSKDLVTVHTDGSEQLSVMCYSPGGSDMNPLSSSLLSLSLLSPSSLPPLPSALLSHPVHRETSPGSTTPTTSRSHLLLSSYLDGNFLAIGSHDNYIYIYAVAEQGRKYGRVGKCSVSHVINSPPKQAGQTLCLPPGTTALYLGFCPTPNIWLHWLRPLHPM